MSKESISPKTFAKGLTACAIIAASLGTLQAGEYNTSGTAGQSAPVTDGFTPGTYSASAAGISSDVLVTATFDENGITEITTDVSGETPGLGADIGDQLIEAAMNAQSAEIDAVTGVTITTDAFKSALNDCINQAAGIGGGSYTPGTYTASAAGISSDVTVTVTVDESSITEITTDVSGETPGLGADVGDQLIEDAMAKQSANIDAITGVTITSDAFKAALTDALAQASGAAPEEAEAAETEAAEAEVAETEAAETEAAATEAAETEAAETEAVETEATATEAVETEAAETEAAATEAAETEVPAQVPEKAASTSRFIPGTYTAYAKGLQSNVGVLVVVDENSIVKILCDSAKETPGIGTEIGPNMIAAAMEKQSADIGWVTGATVSSDAFKTALAAALAQAEAGVVDVKETAEEEPAQETSSGARYIPGTYTAYAKGLQSNVGVLVVVDENSIVKVLCDSAKETPGIGTEIGPDMIAAAMEKQSADIGWVTGATISSDAFKAALTEALDQATVK